MKSVIDEALESNHNRFDDDGDEPRKSRTRADQENKNLRNLPAVTVTDRVVAKTDVEEIDSEQHLKDDYTLAREMARDLLLQQQELIKTMANFVNAAPSPRAFEVFNNMMKTAAELTERLLAVHKQIKEIEAENRGTGPESKQGNTFVLVGGPSSILKDMQEAIEAETKVIDITPE